MLMVIATGAFCPADGLVEAFEASQWRVIAADAIARTETDASPTVAFLEDEFQQLADHLAKTPSAMAVILHVSREEALTNALCDGGEPEAALEIWRRSTLEQVALFRRMRDRVLLVSRRRFEGAPTEFLGDSAPTSFPERRIEPLAFALASWVVAQLPEPDAVASMLAACVRDRDRTDPRVEVRDALEAWRRCAALAADAEATIETPVERGATSTEEPAFAESAGVEVERLRKIEVSRSEEVALLREQLKHLQAIFESAWLEKDEARAHASRQPVVLTGLRAPVVLDAPNPHAS